MEEAIYLSTYPSTYLSRRRWPPLPTYLGGDGHLCAYLRKDSHLPIYFGGIYLPIYLPTYLGGDGYPPSYLGGDDHLYQPI